MNAKQAVLRIKEPKINVISHAQELRESHLKILAT